MVDKEAWESAEESSGLLHLRPGTGRQLACYTPERRFERVRVALASLDTPYPPSGESRADSILLPSNVMDELCDTILLPICPVVGTMTRRYSYHHTDTKERVEQTLCLDP